MGSSSQPRTNRVFISSTSMDLADHRKAVKDILERLGQFAVDMAQFGAQGTGDAVGVSLDKLHSASIYIGIFAWRYGYIPPGEIRSVTHLEYLEACKRRDMPRFLFLAQPQTEQDFALFSASTRDPQYRAQLTRFRAELQSGPVVDYFTSPDDLAKRVAAALHDFLLKKERQALEEQLGGPETRNGTAALQQGNYGLAIKLLGRAQELNPGDGTIAFKYALALLQGRRPGLFREKGDIVQIEELLRAAMLAHPVKEIIAFWGVVKEDYWVQRWESAEDRQEARTLYQRAQGRPSDRSLFNLLTIVQPEVMVKYAARFR